MAKTPTKAKLIALLVRAEQTLTASPRHNPWDLGPCRLLVEIRQAIGLPTGEKRRAP